ncbi:MAG TPA: hypothetical protein VGU01_15715 [Sphingomicrobium sp.]|nr:hypothetical protein [Sphingomicrobium sp.]
MRMRLVLALAGVTLGLSACADDLYGPYGYGGIGYGYGSYGYPWGGAYGYPYGYGSGGYYGSYDPFGWYDDFYYPGIGVYVYDSYRRPYRWNGDQQRYWMSRRSSWQGRTGTTWTRENWGGFRRSGSSPTSGGHWRHRG